MSPHGGKTKWSATAIPHINIYGSSSIVSPCVSVAEECGRECSCKSTCDGTPIENACPAEVATIRDFKNLCGPLKCNCKWRRGNAVCLEPPQVCPTGVTTTTMSPTTGGYREAITIYGQDDIFGIHVTSFLQTHNPVKIHYNLAAGILKFFGKN